MEIYWLIYTVCFIGAVIWQGFGRRPEDDGGELPETNPYTWGRLVTMGDGSLKAALLAMYDRKQISTTQYEVVRNPEALPPSEPYELAIWNSLASGGLITDDIWRETLHVLERYDTEFVQRGLILSKEDWKTSVLGYYLVGGIFFGIGAILFCTRLLQGQTDMSLVFSTIGAPVLAMLGLGICGTNRTWRGQAYIKRMKETVLREPEMRSGIKGQMYGLAVLGQPYMPKELLDVWGQDPDRPSG